MRLEELWHVLKLNYQDRKFYVFHDEYTMVELCKFLSANDHEDYYTIAAKGDIYLENCLYVICYDDKEIIAPVSLFNYLHDNYFLITGIT